MKELNNQDDIQKRIELLKKRRDNNFKKKEEIIKPINKLINKTDIEIDELKLRLRAICKHINITKSLLTTEGGYLNKGYTDYFITCNDCGEVIKTWTENGDYA